MGCLGLDTDRSPLRAALMIVALILIPSALTGWTVHTLAEVKGFEAGQAECWSCHKRHTGNIRGALSSYEVKRKWETRKWELMSEEEVEAWADKLVGGMVHQAVVERVDKEFDTFISEGGVENAVNRTIAGAGGEMRKVEGTAFKNAVSAEQSPVTVGIHNSSMRLILYPHTPLVFRKSDWK